MKTLAIAVVLTLAASAAQARAFQNFYCGKRQDPTASAEILLSPALLRITMRSQGALFRSFRERDGALFYNGRKCREFTEDEYNLDKYNWVDRPRDTPRLGQPVPGFDTPPTKKESDHD